MEELKMVYITRFKVYGNSPTCLDPNARLTMFPYWSPAKCIKVICCRMLYFCAQASVVLNSM